VRGQIQPHDAQWQFLARKVVLAIYRSVLISLPCLDL
jgi:hypothetical protein